MKTTWRKLVSVEMRSFRDDWGNLDDCDGPLDVIASEAAEPFMLWTRSRIYWSERGNVRSVPRHPEE